MRNFIGGSGSDTTAAVQSYLATHRELTPVDLYVINTAPKYTGEYLGKTFLLTNHPSPLIWSYKGTFKTANIERAEVESKISLEAATLDVTWSPLTTDVLVSELTPLQAFGVGVFDNGILEVWRCLMPTVGDCNTLGACLMFSGRIGNIEPDRAKVKMTVTSRLETLNEQVPTNLIEPTNIWAQYVTGWLAPGGPPSLNVVAGSTRLKVFADPVSGTAVDNLYNQGYLVFDTGTNLGGTYRGIRRQTLEAGHVAFYLYEPLPFLPTIGDSVIAYIPVPRDLGSAGTPDVFVQGKSMPWSVSVNPTLNYGANDGASPLIVPITVPAGQQIVIAYISGLVKFSDAIDRRDALGYIQNGPTNSTTTHGYYFPTKYTNQSIIGRGGLIGAFTDSSGVVITPFEIGYGGSYTVPAGATQLQLGIDDAIFSENAGGFVVSVKQGGTTLLEFAGFPFVPQANNSVVGIY